MTLIDAFSGEKRPIKVAGVIDPMKTCFHIRNTPTFQHDPLRMLSVFSQATFIDPLTSVNSKSGVRVRQSPLPHQINFE